MRSAQVVFVSPGDDIGFHGIFDFALCAPTRSAAMVFGKPISGLRSGNSSAAFGSGPGVPVALTITSTLGLRQKGGSRCGARGPFDDAV